MHSQDTSDRKFYDLAAIQNSNKSGIATVCNLFDVAPLEALLLISIIVCEFKFAGVRSRIITIDDIFKFLNIENSLALIMELREPLFNLEYKGLIDILDHQFQYIKVYPGTYAASNEYIALPQKASFVPFANNRFLLSESAIQKLKFL